MTLCTVLFKVHERLADVLRQEPPAVAVNVVHHNDK